MGELFSAGTAPPIKDAAVTNPARTAVQSRVRARHSRASPPCTHNFTSLTKFTKKKKKSFQEFKEHKEQKKPFFLSLSTCSPGSHLVQERSARHRRSNLCSDILHTQEKDGCFPDSLGQGSPKRSTKGWCGGGLLVPIKSSTHSVTNQLI